VVKFSKEALFINSRLIHGSQKNWGIKDRIAASLVIAPKNEQLIHYVEKDEKTHKLLIDSPFFIKYSCFESPI